MFGTENLGRLLLGIAAIIAFTGLVFLLMGKLGIGRLPGDILIRRENFIVFVPITTMIVISVVLTLIFNLFRR